MPIVCNSLPWYDLKCTYLNAAWWCHRFLLRRLSGIRTWMLPVLNIQALQRILHLRKYNGSISFVPAPGFESFGEPSTYKGAATCGINTVNPSHQEPIEVQQHGYQGPNIELEKLEWRTIVGPFVSIWLHNVPWGAENTMAAPDAKVGFLLWFKIHYLCHSLFPLKSQFLLTSELVNMTFDRILPSGMYCSFALRILFKWQKAIYIWTFCLMWSLLFWGRHNWWLWFNWNFPWLICSSLMVTWTWLSSGTAPNYLY